MKIDVILLESLAYNKFCKQKGFDEYVGNHCQNETSISDLNVICEGFIFKECFWDYSKEIIKIK